MKFPAMICGVAALAVASSMAWASPMGADQQGRAKQADRGAIFSQLDADQDGQVTRAEMMAAAQARFAKQDSDGDGALSQSEMKAAAEGRAGKKAEKRFEKMLKRADVDGDGKLSFAELSQKRGDRHFARMDGNGDGAISRDEFANQARLHGQNRAHSTTAKPHWAGPPPAAPIAQIYGTRYALANADAL